MKKSFCRGDIVQVSFKGEKVDPRLYVVVATWPNNNLAKDRVDVIQLKDAVIPLVTEGIGMPIKYLKRVGRKVKVS